MEENSGKFCKTSDRMGEMACEARKLKFYKGVFFS